MSWDSINPFPKGVAQVAAGSNITITGTLANPVISSSGGSGGGVSSITAGSNIVITGTSSDPIISATSGGGGGWVGTATSALNMSSYPITFSGGSLTTDSNNQLNYATTSGTSTPFPMVQWGEFTQRAVSGATSITLPIAYADATYKVLITLGTASVPTGFVYSASRTSSNAFTINWLGGSNVPYTFMWATIGAFTNPPAV